LMDNDNLFDKDTQNKNGEQGQFQQQPYQPQQPYQQQPYQPYQQPPYQGNTDLEEPVTFADWMISTLIMCIPCVGIIMIFVWAFGSNTKKSKSNYFKAMLVWTAIGFVLAIVMGGAFAAILASIADTGLYY
ncbi:MAG: hypothetical protein K2P40_06490, partial [Lachnospiraceae bacterium]|nr:hypothetical protein [Lachnospiraceae bacterium]